jgi:glycosyltransferase involved in cell wall biosynthesis
VASLDPPAVVVAFHLVLVLAFGARWARRLQKAPAPTLDVDPGRPGALTPTISVIVPMRNEARNVTRCLRSLLGLRGTGLEIVVVDDQSEDDTFAQASRIAGNDHRVRILRGQDLAAGWVAKNWALHQGTRAARGEWLLFVDADVLLHPDAALRAVAEADSRGLGLLSLSPRQECGGFWERVIQPLVFAMLGDRYDMPAINDPSTPVAAANGQFLLVRRTVYDALGGHAAVKDRVVEDVALAETVKRRGVPLYFANTTTLASTRMYDGFRALWYGWSKNLFTLLGSDHRTTWRAIALQLVWPLAGVTFVIALGSVVAGHDRWVSAALTGGMALLLLATFERRDGVTLGPASRHIVVSPLAHAVFALMIFNSWYWHTVRGTVWWRGRTYRYHHDEVGA